MSGRFDINMDARGVARLGRRAPPIFSEFSLYVLLF
jgi:hypothetical protein